MQRGDSFLDHLKPVLEILVVALFVVTFLVQPFRIPSESMLPTLRVGDFLLVDKQSFAPVTGLLDRLLPPTGVSRGDLVVFHFPVDPARDVVKRVVAVPGDRVHLRDNHVFVNGQALAEPYAWYAPGDPNPFRDRFPSLRWSDPNIDPRWWAQMRRLLQDGEITVPAGQYFVLGDNRNNSEDSRYWGFVPREEMEGRPLVVYFSLAQAQPDGAEAAVPGSGGAKQRAGSFWQQIRVLR